jgi:hypothetical protein
LLHGMELAHPRRSRYTQGVTTVRVPNEKTLSFDAFWRWLWEHSNCILRAGSADAVLFDHEEFHWVLADEEERRAVVQLLRGKSLVGELVIQSSEVREVTVGPDPETADRGHFLFELLTGPKEDPFTEYHFVLSHGLEGNLGHTGFRH